MAYYLEFDGQNDRVDIGSEIFVSGDGFLFEIDFVYKGTAFDHLVGGSNLFFRINNEASLNLRVDGSSQNLNFNNSLVSGERYYFKLGRTGGTYQLFDENDAPISNSRDLPASPIGISKIGAQFTNANNIPMDFYGLKVNQSGVLIHDYDPSASSGTGQLIDKVSGNHATPNGFTDFEAALIYYDDGSGEPETEIHEFSGNALVNASISASAHKTVSLAGNAQVIALSESSLSKLAEFSGATTVNVSSVSLFEKVTTFAGAASVDVTSQSAFSKRVAFSGESTVDVTSSGVLFDENFELHTFAGGVTISATASGQAIKVGLVSGESRVNSTSSAQAQKVASLSGNAQVNVSAQSAFSKLASLAGNAIARITTAATITKRVLLNGASTVLARVSGTFFNTDSNVETYETTIEGRVKAPLVVKGTVKSLTIEGRVK